jgi:hypothetical protein
MVQVNCSFPFCDLRLSLIRVQNGLVQLVVMSGSAWSQFECDKDRPCAPIFHVISWGVAHE